MSNKHTRRIEINLYNQDGWEALCCAIVQQAIKDYKDKETSVTELIRIREFFLSRWFRFLCSLDADIILSRLDKYRERKGYVDINIILRNRLTNGYYYNHAKYLAYIRNKKG